MTNRHYRIFVIPNAVRNLDPISPFSIPKKFDKCIKKDYNKRSI